MEVLPTPLLGCVVLQPQVHFDERGYFMESYNERAFNLSTGENIHFVQDNQSFSSKGVLRGLHYQTGSAAQAKLVRVVIGEVMDVAVDIRPNSPTFGEYFSIVLSDNNHKQLFIPRGFAHGFVVLSDTALFQYKCDNYYNASAEAGILYRDPMLKIDWRLPMDKLIISEKDQILPTLTNALKL